MRLHASSKHSHSEPNFTTYSDIQAVTSLGWKCKRLQIWFMSSLLLRQDAQCVMNSALDKKMQNDHHIICRPGWSVIAVFKMLHRCLHALDKGTHTGLRWISPNVGCEDRDQSERTNKIKHNRRWGGRGAETEGTLKWSMISIGATHCKTFSWLALFSLSLSNFPSSLPISLSLSRCQTMFCSAPMIL